MNPPKCTCKALCLDLFGDILALLVESLDVAVIFLEECDAVMAGRGPVEGRDGSSYTIRGMQAIDRSPVSEAENGDLWHAIYQILAGRRLMPKIFKVRSPITGIQMYHRKTA